ncbi:MAG: hypothetical protein JEZ07_05575 [Phycisphaerae bacterium]|nr:hypothetical protein [Phycisphaerae bacterium]
MSRIIIFMILACLTNKAIAANNEYYYIASQKTFSIHNVDTGQVTVSPKMPFGIEQSDLESLAVLDSFTVDLNGNIYAIIDNDAVSNWEPTTSPRQLAKINTQTWQVEKGISTGTFHNIESRTDGTMFVMDDENLCYLDTNTWSSNIVGQAPGIAMAISNSGDFLYSLGSNNQDGFYLSKTNNAGVAEIVIENISGISPRFDTLLGSGPGGFGTSDPDAIGYSVFDLSFDKDDNLYVLCNVDSLGPGVNNESQTIGIIDIEQGSVNWQTIPEGIVLGEWDDFSKQNALRSFDLNPVPEPITLSMFMVGGILLFRRTRL